MTGRFLGLGVCGSEKGGSVDMEETERELAYAIAHGVNYFDTAPVYVQGWSERSTGMALKRHPREKYLLPRKCRILTGATSSRAWRCITIR